jgi:plastocyanin
MQKHLIVLGFAVLVVGAVGISVRAQEGDRQKVTAVHDATVQFAMPQPQPPNAGVPGTPDNVSTHFLLPDDVTIFKGGTVNFIVNGGGHGIAIHEVNKKTTRADIAGDLCDGNNNETDPGNESADRIARNAVCNATVVTPVVINGVAVNVVGTNNLNFIVRDAKGNVVIDPGFNVTIPTTPPTVLNNPRLDDPTSSPRLLATSGASPGDVDNPAVIAGNRAGAFLVGTAFNVTTGAGTPGNRIQVQFTKTGRFLVICMNRAHAINDHMFGFVTVVGGDDDDKDK